LEEIIIRGMDYDDLLQVHAIENRSFTTPWELSSFEHEISNRDTILKVAVFSNQIIGYVCIRSILDVTHILDLAVIPECRRKGVGSMLLKDAIEELRKKRPDTKQITLEVRGSNTAATGLYGKFGFSIRGRRSGYYKKPYEDAIIMARDM
jgi:ribosomal-protein-alanine N-acetyltransferase